MSYTILTQSAAHRGLSKVARAYSQAKQTQGEYKFDLRDGTYLVPSIFYKQGQASATVTCCGVDVTDEYIENAFHWTRDSGDMEADAVWNAAHAGMKSVTFAATDIDGDVKISCTLTASSATYGSITVDDDMDASHTPGELDANDIFVIEDGYLKVTTSRGNAYVLENGTLKAAGAKLNGSITAQTKLFASQPEDMVEFSYDHNGLRTQKKVTKADGTVEMTEYTLHGKLVTHLTRGSDEMHFFYDAQSRPAMVEFNGTLYSYTHNLQGDIVGILDSSGNLVVEYGYDAWGKPVVVRTLTTAYDVLAELNPFRYRGYVFDEETGLYYLRNRYYDSSSQRFLNADAIIFMGYCNSKWENLYTYCINAPINRLDISGCLSQLISFASGIARAILSFVRNIFNGTGFTKSPLGARKVSTSSSQGREEYARGVLAQNVEDLRNEWLETNPTWDFYRSYTLGDCIVIGPWFAEKFKEGGDYDYKDGGRGGFKAGETFMFRGEEINLEDFGNINYGYVGIALGFHPDILEWGAAYNHWTKHGDTPEDPRDQEMVRLGMIMAMEDYGYMYEG